MKALTIWQPWASALATGVKQYETRHWKTSYRGPLLIHAASNTQCVIAPSRKGTSQWWDNFWSGQAAMTAAGMPLWKLPPFGAILAVAELVDCIPVEEFFNPKSGHEFNLNELELGNFSAGRFGWKIKVVKLLDEPIPYKGAQGLFDVPDEVLGAQHGS